MSRLKKNVWCALALACITPFLIKTNNKNTCPSYFDYILINFNENCYYNPDVDLSVPEIIKKYTGDVKNYTVTTEDGYILTLFRIVQKNPIGVILLQPPMSAGSIAYLSDGENSLVDVKKNHRLCVGKTLIKNSLAHPPFSAFILWKKGYDVWLSNYRGASYSRQHKTFSENSIEFWNYGFHEVAVHDFEAQFKLIHQKSKSKITFIGYSIAATEALIYASMRPQNSQKYVDEYILIAPLCIMKHFSSIFKVAFYTVDLIQEVFQSGEFLTLEVVRRISSSVTIVPYVVNLMTSLVMGWTPDEMDPSLFPYIFAHHGRGISNQMLRHYGQIFSNQTHFVMYDYKEDNLAHYGSVVPPAYPLQKIKNYVHLIYGERDKISTPEDTKALVQFLPKVAGVFEMAHYNHIDFFFSKHRHEKTFGIVLKALEKVQLREKTV